MLLEELNIYANFSTEINDCPMVRTAINSSSKVFNNADYLQLFPMMTIVKGNCLGKMWSDSLC